MFSYKLGLDINLFYQCCAICNTITTMSSGSSSELGICIFVKRKSCNYCQTSLAF